MQCLRVSVPRSRPKEERSGYRPEEKEREIQTRIWHMLQGYPPYGLNAVALMIICILTERTGTYVDPEESSTPMVQPSATMVNGIRYSDPEARAGLRHPSHRADPLEPHHPLYHLGLAPWNSPSIQAAALHGQRRLDLVNNTSNPGRTMSAFILQPKRGWAEG